jgi:hypothetical protein
MAATKPADEAAAKSPPQLRVGLIVDSVFVSKYVYELADWGRHRDDVRITHALVQQARRETSSAKAWRLLKERSIPRLLRAVLFRLIQEVESLGLRISKPHEDHLAEFDLRALELEVVPLTPIVSKSGLVHRFAARDIERIKALELDALIRCGSGILRGDILRATEFGVISLHHGDNRINRGGPAGFWEVYFRQASTGFVVQQLTEELDGGNVLFRGSFPTQFFFLLNQASLYARANFYLKRTLRQIAAARSLPRAEEPFPYSNPLFKPPSAVRQLRYLSSLAGTVSRKAYHKFVAKKVQRWSVAYSRSDWKSTVMWRAIRIENPPNHFLADPFVVAHGDGDYCFLEDYDYGAGRACISVYKLDGSGAERLGEAIVEPFHMSFPYVFRHDSGLFLVPETCADKSIRIYECMSFPLEWRLKKIVMADVDAADSMIFERDGLWWLFTNIDTSGLDDYSSELFLYYADGPFSDVWTPHPKNPIYVDPDKARNGGLLWDDRFLYRVSQRQGFDVYGAGASINRIRVLNRNDYEEERLGLIEPNFFGKLQGTHHLHSNGNVTVFDFAERRRADR